MPRDDAYKAVQENAMAAWETDTAFANGLRTIRASQYSRREKRSSTF